MAEIAGLISRRGSIKGSITRIERFLERVNTDDVSINVLKGRLEHLNELYAQYNEVQMSLESHDESLGVDRDEVESRYLDFKGKINDLIESKMQQSSTENSQNVRSAAEGQALLVKRDVFHTKMLAIADFVKQADSGTTIQALKLRDQRLEVLYEQYNNVQLELEVMSVDEFSADRNTVDGIYYEVKDKIAEMISMKEESNTSENSAEQSVNSVTGNSNNYTSLPKISIPTFSGDYERWQNFKDLFINLVHNCTNLSRVQKLYYLKSSLRGEAAGLLECLHASEENYNVAWDTLIKRYDNKSILLQTHLKGIFGLPTVNKGSGASLRSFLSRFGQHYNSLKALEVPVAHWDIILVHLLSQKVDGALVRDYENQRNQGEFPVLKGFLEFLEQRCATLELTNESRGFSKHDKNTRTATNASQDVNKCSYCDKSHSLIKCFKFAAIPIAKRRQVVRDKRLCFKCLKGNHYSDKCQSAENCGTCGKDHHSLLHTPKSLGNEKPKQPEAHIAPNANSSKGNREENTLQEQEDTMRTNVCSSVAKWNEICYGENDNEKVILWPLAVVHVIDNNGKKYACRVLLDSASERNYITSNFVDRLIVNKETCDWQVGGVSGIETRVKDKVTLNLASRVSQFKCKVQFGVMHQITGSTPKRYFSMSLLKWPRHVKLADPTFNKVGNIDMLIGTELFAKVIKRGFIDLGVGRPVLQNTEFGWVIQGAVDVDRGTEDFNQTLLTSAVDLNHTMSKFWQLEEISQKAVLSVEEKQCEKLFLESVSRDDTGRYEVDLPVIEHRLDTLGNSYDNAYRCLLSLEKRLMKNAELREQYKNFIHEYLNLNHAKVVDLAHCFDHNNQIPEFYMPHHAVVKESSLTTKVRVVFNASSPSSTGVSLNDILLVGPVVQPDLFTILVRFRMHKYAIIADLTKMYRQVKIKPKFQALQRILWRDTPDEEVKCLQLTTVTYGTASASFLATRTLLELVKDEGASYPLASQAIQSNAYVDDIITGADDYDTAKNLQRELIALLSKGKFELHKWASNDRSLLPSLEQICEVEIPLNEENCSIRTLGIIWKPTEDEFKISIPEEVLSLNKYTKREILSCIARIFDPLGLVGPVAVLAKTVMQNIWKEKIDWDEKVPGHILKVWLSFKANLESLRELKIPRLMVIDKGINVQLHGFSDASTKGYGAAIYLRTENDKEDVCTRLVCSKSRVAPLKPVSLPRLELCGALLLARLAHKVVTVMQHDVHSIELWTDSTIVLAWIRSDASRWNVFVANRVAEIQELFPNDVWRHVQSADNPADLVSRGLEPQLLKESKLWWYGPQWLSQNIDSWPKTYSPSTDQKLPEEKKSSRTCVATQHERDTYLSDKFEEFSKFTKLQRTFAYVIRFAHNIKNKPQFRTVGCLTVKELEDSLLFIVKKVQESSFADEISSLSDTTKDKNNSKSKARGLSCRLRSLNPFLDIKGLLRVGGRLKYAPVTIAQRHPLIIPNKNHVTRLIISREHERLLHAGVQLTLANLRLKFWPIGGRSEVKRLIRNCIKCFRFRAVASSQIMADLPAVRVTPSRPFLHTGVDYAGPISIRQSRIRKSIVTKGYICLFVCMCTKAIHLELVSDMTTKSFLGALNRFMSRRGQCSKIFSDNGTNFKGANQELRKLYEMFNSRSKSELIYDSLAKEGIEWIFIPPLSPHWGGIWEAGVKSVKFHLKRMLGDASLTYEELNSLLIQIEGILNSRPLCAINSEPDDLEYLTPAHFLVGSSITNLPENDVLSVPSNRLSFWTQMQQIKQAFWKRWSKEYLSELQQRKKWQVNESNIKLNALVLVKEDNVPPLKWCLGRVLELHHGKDNNVRSVLVKTKNGNYVRPITRICSLPDE